MKRTLSFVGISLIIILAIESCGTSKNIAKGKEKKIEVNQAFEKVYNATQQALKEIQNSELDLERIDLTFATTTTTDISGGVKLWVVSGKYQRTKSHSQKATFTFEQDENTTKSLVEDKSIKYFKDYLVAVINGAKGIKSVNSFGLQEIEVEVEFIIKNSVEGGAEIEISPITPFATVNRVKEAVHTITIKLKKK
jgi:hypothetical protein